MALDLLLRLFDKRGDGEGPQKAAVTAPKVDDLKALGPPGSTLDSPFGSYFVEQRGVVSELPLGGTTLAAGDLEVHAFRFEGGLPQRKLRAWAKVVHRGLSSTTRSAHD